MKKFRTDEELFAALKKGDSSALTQFYLHVVPGLRAYSKEIVKDQEIAHGVAIIKVCICLKRIEEFKTYDDWLKYLFTCISNQSKTELKKKKRRDLVEKTCDPEYLKQIPISDPVREIIATEVQGFIREAIAGISGKRKAIALLALLEGWSSKDLAEVLKLSKSAIDNERNRGKKYLRDFFKNNWFKILF